MILIEQTEDEWRFRTDLSLLYSRLDLEHVKFTTRGFKRVEGRDKKLGSRGVGGGGGVKHVAIFTQRGNTGNSADMFLKDLNYILRTTFS